MNKILFFAIFSIGSIVLGHNKVGNGGGGLRLGPGLYSTFASHASESYSADKSMTTAESESCSSPVFTSMKVDLRRMRDILPVGTTQQLVKLLCQSGRSRYQSVSVLEAQNHIYAYPVRKLKRIYSEATKYEEKDIVIFALTYPYKQKTFLFPEFFNLSFLDQKLILFHELFWIHKFPDGTPLLSRYVEIAHYKKILNLDFALQNYLVDPDVSMNQTNFRRAYEALMRLNY